MRQQADLAKQQLLDLAARGVSLGLPLPRDLSAQRRSAVLMLFGALDDVPPHLDVLLMRRSDSASHHPGQISFPGGGLEAVDKGDPAIAALREAAEETALDPAGVEVLGSFADAHVPVSANIVTPVLGWWRLPSEVAADHDESVEVFRVPVAELLDADARGIVSIEFGDRVFESPAFELNERFGSHVVWGFTGLLLSSLFDQLGWAEPWDHGRSFDVPL